MFDSPNQSRRSLAGKALVVLVSATGCLAAVAYAASSPPGDRAPQRPRTAGDRALAAPPRRGVPRPPRPRLVSRPARSTLSTRVGFRYVVPRTEASFQCKLDAGDWKRCGSWVAYRGLAVGPHRFLVRAEAAGGGRSLPARFAWVQVEPKSFSITPELSSLSQLYPGSAPVSVPLVLSNPNSAPIVVTALRMSVSADPAACPSGENLELIQAPVSRRSPVRIPAAGSVRLPAGAVAAPAIALRNLPVNQDACQGARFPLAFAGEARG